MDNGVRLDVRAVYDPIIAGLIFLIPTGFIVAGIALSVSSKTFLAIYVPLGIALAAMYLVVMPKRFRLYEDGVIEVVNLMGCSYFRMTVDSVEMIPMCTIVTGCPCKILTACSGNVMLKAKQPTWGCITKLLISPREPEEFVRVVKSVIDIDVQP